MEQKTIKEYFEDLPKKQYSIAVKEVFEAMKISRATFYNWKSGRTNPSYIQYCKLIEIVNSYNKSPKLF